MNIAPIIQHLRGAYNVHDLDDGAEYRDGFERALTEVEQLWAEWEPCDEPTGEHDDGDPMLCALRAGHDGGHDHLHGLPPVALAPAIEDFPEKLRAASHTMGLHPEARAMVRRAADEIEALRAHDHGEGNVKLRAAIDALPPRDGFTPEFRAWLQERGEEFSNDALRRFLAEG